MGCGREENIITIRSKDSCASPDGCSSNSGNNTSLGGGAIAGIVIGAVIVTLLIAAAIIYLIRRQRKKKAYISHDPAADMAVITGPVHNHHSQRTGKYFSPETVGTSTDADGSEDIRGTNGGSNNDGSIPGESSHQELDGQDTQVAQNVATGGSQDRPLHGEMNQLDRDSAPIYYELGGTEVAKMNSDAVSSSGGLPPRVERDEGDGHLDSPFVSTLGSSGWQDKRGDASSDLVSPSTPVHPKFS